MSIDGRKKPRKPIKTVGFIYSMEGWPIGECSTLDISESGAKIMLPVTGDLPPEFFLALSRDGRVRRRCQLKWRDGDKIGVRFTAVK
jgi:hypothetical protein